MPSVETVQGAVDADELGLVLVHEHVRFRDEAVAEQWPTRYDEQLEYDAALVAVNAAKQRGVQTIVDPTAMFGGRDVRFMKRVAERDRRADRGVHRHLQLRLSPPLLRQSRRRRDGRPLRRGHRTRHPGHRHQGRVPEVRGGRGRSDRERREDPSRGGTREPADGRVDHGALDAGGRDRAASGRDLRGGGRRHVARADRPLRRHRRPRLHRGADRQRRVRRPRPLRPGDVPADRQAQCDRCGAAAPRPRRAADDLPGLLRVDRLVPAGGGRGSSKPVARSATGR